ncbi:MAG: transcriptional repressor [Bacteroidaceae bacterium]|nr:transcriptional repressor [Bacteroidaceae bacterium]
MMDKAESLRQARQKLSDYVRINSMRNTPERVALLEAIYSTDAPFSAEALSSQMSQKRRMRISRATVYNNLGLFEKAGLVRKVFLNDHVLFERTDREKGVIRMLCGGCGKVTEMDDRIRHQIDEMRTKRFTMTGWSLTVYGLCSKCMASLKRKQNKLKNKTDKDKK